MHDILKIELTSQYYGQIGVNPAGISQYYKLDSTRAILKYFKRINLKLVKATSMLFKIT